MSIVAQSSQDFEEVIIVEDGSTFKSDAIVEKYKSQISIQYLEKDNTCLLYTSPSPRDQRGSRMPSSA